LKPDIVIKKSAEEIIEAAAEYFKNFVADTENKKNIMLSGGNTPKLLFKNIVDCYSSKIGWEKINFWWGDERCVPPTHKDSNYGMAKEYLIDKILIPGKNIFRIRGEADPKIEAQIYGDLMEELLPKHNGIPQYDLVYLGIGEDGHTASIFPDNIELFNSNFNCLTTIHPESKQQRISISGKIINNAKNVFVLITGKNKAKTVEEILNHRQESINYPAALVNPVNGKYIWYLDKEAASLI
jgi:6-phosphogluconolactonase